MPRKKNTEQTIFPKIGLKKGLKEEIDKLLVDEETGKVPFGSWMKLVDKLLREWVRKKKLSKEKTKKWPHPDGFAGGLTEKGSKDGKVGGE